MGGKGSFTNFTRPCGNQKNTTLACLFAFFFLSNLTWHYDVFFYVFINKTYLVSLGQAIYILTNKQRLEPS